MTEGIAYWVWGVAIVMMVGRNFKGRKMSATLKNHISQPTIPAEPNLSESQLQLLSLASVAGFPPVFGADKLSLLIQRDVATIFADRSRAPHKIPPACLVPGTRSPVWLLDDVLRFIASYREPAAPIPHRCQVKSKAPSPGRPTKAEQHEAESLGITIRELHVRRAEEGRK